MRVALVFHFFSAVAIIEEILRFTCNGLGHMTVDILGKATFSIRVSPFIERRDLPR